jgi:hypothetical protein
MNPQAWWDAKGDWTRAHESAQEDEGPEGNDRIASGFPTIRRSCGQISTLTKYRRHLVVASFPTFGAAEQFVRDDRRYARLNS